MDMAVKNCGSFPRVIFLFFFGFFSLISSNACLVEQKEVWSEIAGTTFLLSSTLGRR